MLERRLEKIDYFLVSCVVIVVLCGIFTLYTQESHLPNGLGKWYRQLLYFAVGLLVMYVMSRINYQFLESYAIIIYFTAIALLVLTRIIGYVPDGHSARSWLKIGSFRFQTSEFAKLATVILLGQHLVLQEKGIKNIVTLIIPFAVVLLPMLLIIIQPDFGTAISFVPILIAMLFLGGADILHIASLLLLGGISLCVPMYIAYTKLTLNSALEKHLAVLGKSEILLTLKKAEGKIGNIWAYAEGKKAITKKSLAALKDETNMQAVRRAMDKVILENTNFLYKLLSNTEVMVSIAAILLVLSGILLLLKLSQGSDSLRKFYIPLGVIGISILLSVAVNKKIPFKVYQVERLTAFINPDQFKRGVGYQLNASKTAVGSGQLVGKGFFHAEMTSGRTPYVPESSTDFIFASWAEQTGFFGAVLLLFFLMAIPLRGLQISFESKDRFGSLLAAGIVAMIFFHMFINIGIVIGVLPVTGLPLSFMSYGGSHLVMSMAAVGIIISIKLRKHAN